MPKPFKAESRHWLLMAALALSAYASYRLIEPYLGSIVMAFIISLLYYPLHARVEAKIPRQPNSAAIISCTILTFIIVIPVLIVFSSIVHQGSTFSKESYLWLTSGGARKFCRTPLP